jgi:hypothetical protein
MSWHFSRALAAAFLPGLCLVGDASALSKSTPTPEAFYWPDKTTGHSRLSRFGMTSEPLTGDLGAELLTSFRAAFPAKTSALQEKATDSTASGPGFGWKWPASFAKFDLDSSSWRTRQCSLLGDLSEFSGTWPRWGSMRNGECLERQTLVPRINENESGYWPTPTVHGNTNKPGASAKAGWGLGSAVKHWPTPIASDARGSSGRPKQGKQVQLVDAVRIWPTPLARDYRHPPLKAYSERGGGTKGEQLPKAVGGPLNPPWVEWLMGWPVGWTDLKPLETDKFQEWQRQHSSY